MLNLQHGQCVRQTLWGRREEGGRGRREGEGGREGGRRGEDRGDGPEGEHIPLLQGEGVNTGLCCGSCNAKNKTTKGVT